MSHLWIQKVMPSVFSFNRVSFSLHKYLVFSFTFTVVTLMFHNLCQLLMLTQFLVYFCVFMCFPGLENSFLKIHDFPTERVSGAGAVEIFAHRSHLFL